MTLYKRRLRFSAYGDQAVPRLRPARRYLAPDERVPIGSVGEDDARSGKAAHLADSGLVEKIVHQLRRRRVQPRRLLQVRQARPRHRLGRAEGVQERALARRADAGISSSGLLTKSFLRRARCVPMAKRCASSRSRWTKNSAGSRGGAGTARGPRQRRSRGPALRSGPLAIAASATPSTPSAAKTSRAASNWPRPPSMTTRSGVSGKARRPRAVSPSPLQPREAPRQHLAHHGVVVARREVGALDVEGAVGDFTKPSGPATTIAPIALVPMMWELS